MLLMGLGSISAGRSKETFERYSCPARPYTGPHRSLAPISRLIDQWSGKKKRPGRPWEARLGQC
jgi:hypothetical protein